MKTLRFKTFLNTLIVILLLIGTTFGMTACLDTGSSSGGPSSGGSSGSSSSGGKDEEDEGDGKVAISSGNEDDFFSGVLIMYDAGYSGEFYDEATSSKKKFTELLDREITSFTAHLIYGLNVLYGDNTIVTSSQSDTYNLLDISITSGTSLTDFWGNVENLTVKPATILSDTLASGSYCLNTINYELDKEGLASSISTVAGFGADSLGALNQFNFNNAIDGGYVYEVDANNEGKGKFTEELNTQYAWSLDISESLFDETIRKGIANILSLGKYESGSLSEEYNTCLENIEYLGFSPNDLENIAEYICKEVIGSAYNLDEGIRGKIDSSKVASSEEGQDLYPTDTSAHYYRAYHFAVRILLERMAYITRDGLYALDSDSEVTEDSKLTYLIMPRTNIAIRKCSELFREDEDSASDIYNPETGEYNFKYDPILKSIKLKQIIFLPKLSEEVLEEYRKQLEEDYGSSYQNYYDARFVVQSINMGLNGTIFTEESRFICLPIFTIKAEGEVVYSDKVKNEVAGMEDYPIEAFHDDYSYELDAIYNAESDAASFNLSDVMKGSKFSDYSGVEVFDDKSKPNEEYFHSDSGEYYLIVDKGASTIEDSGAIYQVNYLDGNFQFTFNGGDNFLQIDFSYFGLDSTDIYNNDTASKIPTQIIDLVTLSIWT